MRTSRTRRGKGESREPQGLARPVRRRRRAGGAEAAKQRAPAAASRSRGAGAGRPAGAGTAARPGGAAADTTRSAPRRERPDGMVRTGDLSRSRRRPSCASTGPRAAGGPHRRRVRDRLVGRSRRPPRRRAPRRRRGTRWRGRARGAVEEGPRLADYGIGGASGLGSGTRRAGGPNVCVCV